jgi:hypothetical protein
MICDKACGGIALNLKKQLNRKGREGRKVKQQLA